MKRPVSPRERRLVALLILMAAIAMSHFLMVAPIVEGFASRAERREQLALQYTYNLRTIAAIPRLRQQAEQQRMAVAAFAIEVRNVEEGREWLKARLARAVAEAGGAYRNGDDAESRPGWAGARASATMTPAQLAALLARLQNEPPWLIVDSLTVSAKDRLEIAPAVGMDIEIEASIPIRNAPAG